MAPTGDFRIAGILGEFGPERGPAKRGGSWTPWDPERPLRVRPSAFGRPSQISSREDKKAGSSWTISHSPITRQPEIYSNPTIFHSVRAAACAAACYSARARPLAPPLWLRASCKKEGRAVS